TGEIRRSGRRRRCGRRVGRGHAVDDVVDTRGGRSTRWQRWRRSLRRGATRARHQRDGERGREPAAPRGEGLASCPPTYRYPDLLHVEWSEGPGSMVFANSRALTAPVETASAPDCLYSSDGSGCYLNSPGSAGDGRVPGNRESRRLSPALRTSVCVGDRPE